MQRYLSRKFIVTLISQLAALAILIAPQFTDQINDAASAITAIAALVVSGLAYVLVEGKVDAKGVEAESNANAADAAIVNATAQAEAEAAAAVAREKVRIDVAKTARES